MDVFARGLKAAAGIRADGRLDEFIATRYSGWDQGLGAKIEADESSLADLETHALSSDEPGVLPSGRQEMLENLLNDFI
jgi:xylose isomerase